MLYDNLAGIELTIQDRGLILPAEEASTATVLIIAPTTTNGVAGPYLPGEYNPVTIAGQEDFESKGLGVYNADNPMARLWKQCFDAGCRDIQAVQLKGTTEAEKYGFLHDIFYVLEENMNADIVLVGGIYADDTISGNVTFVYERADYSDQVMTDNQLYTAVTDETAGTGDAVETEFTLAHAPIISDYTLTKYAGTVAAVFTTGAFTAIGDNDTGKTISFLGVTATVKTSATPVAAAASSATAGSVTIANTATPASTATAFKAVFDAIKAAYPASAIASFTFTVETDALIATDAVINGNTNNSAVFSGTATFAYASIPASQLTTPGVGTVAAVPAADVEVDRLTGKVTFGTAPAADIVIKATYKYYTFSFAAQLAGFCEVVSTKNTQVLGVIGLNPAGTTDLALIKAYIDGQKTQKFSKYLQVVGGPEMLFGLGSSNYWSIAHGAYAGLISVLPSYSSPMFKAIPGAIVSSFNLSPTQITSLINKHIVVPRVRNGRIIIADAITTADDTSDFVRLSTVRIANDVVSLVREIAEPYIGEPNTIIMRNALDTAIRSGLQAMINRGALNDFRFHIKSTIADQIEGNMRILLDIVPVFETRRILMSVAVKPMLS